MVDQLGSQSVRNVLSLLPSSSRFLVPKCNQLRTPTGLFQQSQDAVSMTVYFKP